MTVQTSYRIAIGAAVVLFLVWGGLTLTKRHQVTVGTKNEQQAQEFKGEANATKAQAQHSDAEYETLKASHVSDQADVDRSRAEVQRLSRLLAAQRAGIHAPDVPAPTTQPVDPGPDLHSQLDLAKDGLISDLTKQNDGLKAENALLVTDRDQWRATAELREKQALAQEAATNAWKKAVTEARWQGRFEGGGAVGTAWTLSRLLAHL